MTLPHFSRPYIVKFIMTWMLDQSKQFDLSKKDFDSCMCVYEQPFFATN
jgi:hypothetical protein